MQIEQARFASTDTLLYLLRLSGNLNIQHEVIKSTKLEIASKTLKGIGAEVLGGGSDKPKESLIGGLAQEFNPMAIKI